MAGISFTELLMIAVVALLVLGPEKLPTLLKAVGRAMREFKRASRELRDQLDIDGTLRDAMGETPLRRPPTPPRPSVPNHVPGREDGDDAVGESTAYPSKTPYADTATMDVLGPAGAIARFGHEAAPTGARRAAPVAPRPAGSPGPLDQRSLAPTAAFGRAPVAPTDDLDAGWSEGDRGEIGLSLAPNVRPSAPPPPPASAEASVEASPGRRRGRRGRKGAAPAAPPSTPSGNGGKKSRRRRGR